MNTYRIITAERATESYIDTMFSGEKWELIYNSNGGRVNIVVSATAPDMTIMTNVSVDLVGPYKGIATFISKDCMLEPRGDGSIKLTREEAGTLLRVIKAGWSGLDHDEVKFTNTTIDKLKG